MLSRKLLASRNSWTPAEISTEAWWDFSDIDTLWQNTSATTAVTANNHPIGRVDDKSGNGRNFLQLSSTLRPLYKTSGAEHASFDGSNDKLDYSGSVSGLTNISIWLSIDVTDPGTFLLLTEITGSADFILVGQNASALSSYANAGTPTYYKDGASFGTTRDNVFDALNGAGAVVIEARTVSLASFVDFSIMGYPAFESQGLVYEMLITTTAVSNANRTNIATYMAAQLP